MTYTNYPWAGARLSAGWSAILAELRKGKPWVRYGVLVGAGVTVKATPSRTQLSLQTVKNLLREAASAGVIEVKGGYDFKARIDNRTARLREDAPEHWLSPDRAPEALYDDPEPAQVEMLTELELAAIDLTAELANAMARIIGHGRSRDGDIAEACHHIHNLQHMIMAQAAARAYPSRFRLLGESIG